MKPPPAPALSIVTVSHRSAADVAGLLESIAAHPPAGEAPPETLVVDNAGGADGVADVVARFAERHGPWARCVTAPENRGMGSGLNLGARLTGGPSLLLVNPDVRFGPGALTAFARHARRAAERPVIVGPRLLNGDGSLQLSAGPFPTLLRLLAGQLLPRAERMYAPQRLDAPSRVDWATGACLLVPRGVYEALGGFDEGFFLYYEEVDLCRRARRLGVWTVYDPRITCTHLHPLQDRAVPPVIAGHILRSRRRYFARHCGPLETTALRIIERLKAEG
jgi:GT2 family glycosyltransferase